MQKKIKEIYNLILEEKYKEAYKILNELILSHEVNNKNYGLIIIRKYNMKQSEENKKIFEQNYKMFLLVDKKSFSAVSQDIFEYMESGKLPTQQYDIDTLLYNLYNAKNLRLLPEKIKIIMDEMIIKLRNETNFISMVESKIDSARSNYENEFYKILTSNDPRYTLSEFDWTDQAFYYKLSRFKKKYTSQKDIELANYIEEKYQKYIEFKQNKTLDSGKVIYYVPIEIIQDLFASNCSIYEYCDNNSKYSVPDITREIRILYKEKANDIISKLEKLESPFFQQKLEEIASMITNDPNFSVVDYYLNTKLNLIDFKKRLKHYNNEVSRFVSKYSNVCGKIQCVFSKEGELRTKRIINGKEITIEEKEMIFDFLMENDIPISQFTYRDCLNKLLNGEFNSLKKIKTYKGSI